MLASLMAQIFGLPSWAKKVLLAASVISVAVVAFTIWRVAHDNAVRKADRAALDAKAVEKAQEAAKGADAAQDVREGAFNASQAELRNSVSADDYLRRLRHEQDRQRSASTK